MDGVVQLVPFKVCPASRPVLTWAHSTKMAKTTSVLRRVMKERGNQCDPDTHFVEEPLVETCRGSRDKANSGSRESNARLELREESDAIDEEGVKAKPRFRA